MKRKKQVRQKVWAVILAILLVMGGLIPGIPGKAEAAEIPLKVIVKDGDEATDINTETPYELKVGEAMEVYVAEPDENLSYELTHDGTDEQVGKEDVDAGKWKITAKTTITEPVTVTVKDNSDQSNSTSFTIMTKKDVSDLALKDDVTNKFYYGDKTEYKIIGDVLDEDTIGGRELTYSFSERYDDVIKFENDKFIILDAEEVMGEKTVTITITANESETLLAAEVEYTFTVSPKSITLDDVDWDSTTISHVYNGSSDLELTGVVGDDTSYEVKIPVTLDNENAGQRKIDSIGTIEISADGTNKGNYTLSTDVVALNNTFSIEVVPEEVELSDFGNWEAPAPRVYNGTKKSAVTGTLNKNENYRITLPVILDAADVSNETRKRKVDSIDYSGEITITDGTNLGNYVLKKDIADVSSLDGLNIEITKRPIYLGTKNFSINYGVNVKEAFETKQAEKGSWVIIIDAVNETGIIKADEDSVKSQLMNVKATVDIEKSVGEGESKNGKKYNINVEPTDNKDVIIVDKSTMPNPEDINSNYSVNISTNSDDIGDLTITQDMPELKKVLENITLRIEDGKMYPENAKESGFYISAGTLKASIIEGGDFDPEKKNPEYYGKVMFGGTDLVNEGYVASGNGKKERSIYLEDSNNENNTTVPTTDKFYFYVDIDAPEVDFADLKERKLLSAWDKITFGIFTNLKIYKQQFTFAEPALNKEETEKDENVEKIQGSGIDSVQYFVWELKDKKGKNLEDSELTREKVIAKVTELNEEKKWESVNNLNNGEASVGIPEGNNAVLVKTIDNVGNEAIYVSNGIVIEWNAPVIELDMEEKEYYTVDIPYTLTVNDNSRYTTAIDEVDIKVTNRGKTTKGDSENIADIDNDDNNKKNDNIDYSVKELRDYSEKVIEKQITSERNNSNDVKLKVTAVDNAGNKTVFTKSLKIDITKPEIAVSYNNNSAVNGKYFKGNRVMTIVFTERNLDKNKVTFDVKAGPDISGQSITKNVSVSDLSKFGISAGWVSDSESNLSEKTYTDERKNTLKLTFNKDNEYYIFPHCVDKAGLKNKAVKYAEGTQAAKEFVIDKTRPIIKVSFDNNDALNGFYYDAPRKATMTIDEHNFRSSDVETEISASHQTDSVSAPRVNGWTSQGDKRTATIDFTRDGDYEFTVDYTDLAGNKAKVYTVDKFVIDQTKPEIEFFDVVDMSANNGTVAPGVSYMDVNYDTNGVDITISGPEHPTVNVDGSRTTEPHGESIKMADFAHEPDVDDVYTLNAEIRDKAGNSHQDSVTFSVNRFGSNFIFSTDTKKFLDKYYNNKEQDLVVTEINVDTLEHRNISYGRDGDLKKLEEGKDYQVSASGSEVSWKSYRYTIPAEEFEKEGHYDVTIDSRDRATNEVNNKIKDAEIEFVIDKTNPTVVITGVEDGKSYKDSPRDITIDVEDNVSMGEVKMFINDEAKETFTAKEVQEYVLEQGGQIPYKVDKNRKPQDIRAVAYDAAGNPGEATVKNVMINPNIFVRIINSPLLLIAVLAVLAAGGVLLFFMRKRRKEAEQA